MDTMHLKDPLVLFGFEDYVLSLPLFVLSHALSLFFNTGKGPLYGKNVMELNGLNVPMCQEALIPIIHSRSNFGKLTSACFFP